LNVKNPVQNAVSTKYMKSRSAW